MDTPITGFIIWSPSGNNPPKKVHPAYQEAEAEAERLAKLNPRSEFYICPLKTLVRVTTPVEKISL